MNESLFACHKSKKIKSDPASAKYAKAANSSEHNKSPYGDQKPSIHTSYK